MLMLEAVDLFHLYWHLIFSVLSHTFHHHPAHLHQNNLKNSYKCTILGPLQTCTIWSLPLKSSHVILMHISLRTFGRTSSGMVGEPPASEHIKMQISVFALTDVLIQHIWSESQKRLMEVHRPHLKKSGASREHNSLRIACRIFVHIYIFLICVHSLH